MDARDQQEQITKVLYRSVMLALQREGDDWYEPVAKRARVLAHRLFIDIFDGDVMPIAYKRELVAKVRASLDKGEHPGQMSRKELRDRADLISTMIAHYVVDSVVTAGAPSGWVKAWVSQQDDRVRTTHREVHGEVVPVSDKFSVGGAEMEGPGDLTAPVDEIAGCRCYLLFGPDRESLTAATLLAGGTDMTVTEDEQTTLLDAYEEVPWYGVLAPEGVSTGDGRKFDADSLTWRDLPLPLRWQKYDDEGHKGSVVVGSIDTIERRDGLMHATGRFSSNAEAAEVIALVAEKALRGVSVDLDDAEMEFRHKETGEVMPDTFDSIEEAMDAQKYSEAVVTKGRICSAAMCAIPAFAEAFVALGYPPEPDTLDEAVERDAEALAAAAYATIDEKPWSDYPESAYDIPQWHKACLVHLHSGPATNKSDCKLPIRTPSGSLSRAGVHAAASRVNQTDAPASQIAAAKRALVRAYGELGEDPPESLTASTDFVHEYADDDMIPGVEYTNAEEMILTNGKITLSNGQTIDVIKMTLTALDDEGKPVATETVFSQHDLIFLENRRTPKVVSKGAKYEPKPSEGRITKRRAATAEEEKTIARGDWVRVNEKGKRPGQPGYMEKKSKVRPQNNSADIDDIRLFEHLDQYADLAPGRTEDGPGWLTHPVDTDRLRDYWVRGAGAAKIGWGLPGDFNRCRAHLSKYIKPQHLSGYCANRHYDALGFWPGHHAGKEHSLAASTGIPVAPAFSLIASGESGPRPPKAWFLDPELPEITPMTITNEGRIYGHMAQWGTCHTGFEECIEPPVSETNYQMFHLGAVMTDEGEIPCGVLTVDTGHAANNWSLRKALAHYDDTGTVVAHIRVGEDEHGIWFAGAIASYATEQQVDKLRAAKVSGDWRGYRGNLELIAALGVNAPGFPIVRPALAASAGVRTSLVAAGLIHKESTPTHEDVETIVARALSEYREFDAIKAAVIEKRRAELATLRRKD